MADPMKIRAQLKGDEAVVRVLMSHPMETGQRKDGEGKVIPAHHIQTLTVALNGKTVVSGQTGGSVSRNPVFGFKLKGAKTGDKISVSWKDNKGDSRTDETTVS
ncbi:MAG: thiosulfate oxidation carrier complex protein SoxZ [Pseudomonadota bacterium]